MELNTEALLAACHETAKITLWQPVDEKQPTEEEVEDLAEAFYAMSKTHLDYISEQGYDPNILVRAVRYLGHTHAIPPMKDDARWFGDMLEVLIEIACPNVNLPRKGEDFLEDLRHGLSAKAKIT